jgi:hypothetical protein
MTPCCVMLFISVSCSTDVSLVHSFLSLMPHKQFTVFKIAFNCNKFQPSNAISGNCSLTGTAALHQFVRQCIPCYCMLSFTLQGIHGRLVKTTHGRGITWMPQNENNVGQRDRIHSQTHFSANENMQ